jgi:putative ubiquitin-RnfH superfamily antitoxin RatB of RatAB toxin-antitoxin module
MLPIEVVYGDSHSQTLLNVEIESGQTISDVLKTHLPNLDLENQPVGIWGQVVSLNHVLQENERIEIYRPLLIDPKAARRERGITGSKVRKNKRKNIRNYRALQEQM